VFLALFLIRLDLVIGVNFDRIFEPKQEKFRKVTKPLWQNMTSLGLILPITDFWIAESDFRLVLIFCC
jgi:hypothetical protein